MPRRSRIDAAGALHHIIARGIEKGKIFRDNSDRNNFLERLGEIVEDMEALGEYRYSGHSTIMGRVKRDWQDTRGVLRFYGERLGNARRRYKEFVQEGIIQGKRVDLTGGGFIRSHGGWAAVGALRRAKIFQKSDERILGDGNFVEEVLSASQECMERKYHLQAQGIDLSRIASRVSELMAVEPLGLWGPGKERNRVSARSLLCYWAVRGLGLSMAELSRKLRLSVSGVSQSVKRGEIMAENKAYKLNET